MKTGKRMPVPGICDVCGDSVSWCPHWQRLTESEANAIADGTLRIAISDIRLTPKVAYVRRVAMNALRGNR